MRIDDDGNDKPARPGRQDHVGGGFTARPGLSIVELYGREFDVTLPPDEVAANILDSVQTNVARADAVQRDAR